MCIHIHTYICIYPCCFVLSSVSRNVHKTYIYFITTNRASACLSYEICALMPPMWWFWTGNFLMWDFYETLNESFCWQICINIRRRMWSFFFLVLASIQSLLIFEWFFFGKNTKFDWKWASCPIFLLALNISLLFGKESKILLTVNFFYSFIRILLNQCNSNCQ